MILNPGLNLSIDFEHVAVRVTEEQRAMTKWLVSWSGKDANAALDEDSSAALNLAGCDAECKLQGEHANGWRGIVKDDATLRKC